MAKYSKKIKENVDSFYSHIGSSILSLKGKWWNKYRVKSRLRWLNIWACGHRKKFFAYSIGVMIAILACDIVSSIALAGRSDSDPLRLGELTEQTSFLDEMQQIKRNSETIKNQQEKLVAQGNLIINRLDSLTKLKTKTHDDSVQIVSLYRKLELINNFINNDSQH